MKCLAKFVDPLIILLVMVAEPRAQVPKPTPEQTKWDFWVGDWTLVGTARDAPTDLEYKSVWTLHGRPILGGFFVQVDQVWKGNGPEEHSLEILSYDPSKRTHTSTGFTNFGSTWVATATYDDGTVVETGTTTTSGRKVIKFRGTYVFSPDRMAVSMTSESEMDGVRWTNFTVKGTKAKAPVRTK